MNKSKVNEIKNFPPRVRNYLLDILSWVEKLNLTLVSIVLFGSLAKGGYQDGVSDVDLVFILDDNHHPRDKAVFDAIITELEYKHGFRKETDSKIDYLYSIAENMTGMFISHFVCFRIDYIQSKFDKVFNVNPFLSRLVAPSAIVWNSVLKSSKTIWGENINPRTRPVPIRSYHVMKSMLMNLLLNILAYATFLLHPNSTKFSMEAVKWSLHSCYFCFEQSSSSVEKVASYFISKLSKEKKPLLGKLINLRKDYHKNSIFIWKSITSIIEIHRITINHVDFPIYVEK